MEEKTEKTKKLKPLKSGLSPETEKRLLGNLSPPKRKVYSYSEKPPPYQKITLKLKKAPKAAENMSKLTSVQVFIKDFTELETEVHMLRQLSCPPTTERLFDAIADIRSSLPTFETHCKTIAKQKKLQTQVNKKCFDFYKDFVSSFGFFGEKMELFEKQIHTLYSAVISEAFGKINQSVLQFIDICLRDPQGRTIITNYRKYVEDSIKNLEKRVVPFIADKEFKALSEEELEEFSETTKTFGRFYEKELAPLIASVLLPKFSITRQIQVFHEYFVKLVPYITSAPIFIEQYKVALEALDKCKSDMKKVKREIGNEKILKCIDYSTVMLDPFNTFNSPSNKLIESYKNKKFYCSIACQSLVIAQTFVDDSTAFSIYSDKVIPPIFNLLRNVESNDSIQLNGLKCLNYILDHSNLYGYHFDDLFKQCFSYILF